MDWFISRTRTANEVNMAILIIKQMVMPTFVFEVGDVVELDPLKEANWIAAGWAWDWDEDDERVYLDNE